MGSGGGLGSGAGLGSGGAAPAMGGTPGSAGQPGSQGMGEVPRILERRLLVRDARRCTGARWIMLALAADVNLLGRRRGRRRPRGRG